jgi:hypothetical protein
MPRRASSSIHPVWVAAGALVVLAAIIGGRVLFREASDPYRTIPALQVSSYLENANSLRGNVYKVQGTVLNSLAWSPLSGRLFSLEVKQDGTDGILPVLLPTEFNHINIQKGQELQLQLEVGDKGILTAKDVRKA